MEMEWKYQPHPGWLHIVPSRGNSIKGFLIGEEMKPLTKYYGSYFLH